MKYLLTQTRNGYVEVPVQERDTEYEENMWQLREGRQVFLLGAEEHLFIRKTCVTISAGKEASLKVHDLQSRFYIKEMHIFAEVGEEAHLYLNQRELMPKNSDFILQAGDILFLKNIKIEIWENQIAVHGSPDAYTTTLLECSLPQKPKGFPVYKRSPRLIKRPSAEKVLVGLTKENVRGNRRDFLMTVLPPLAMTAVTLAIGVLSGRGIYLLLSAVATGMTAVLAGIQYVGEKRERKRENREQAELYTKELWRRLKEIAVIYEQEQEVYAYQYPEVRDLARMVGEYDSRIYERIASDDDFLTLSVGVFWGRTDFQIDRRGTEWDTKGDVLRRYDKIKRPRVIDLKKAHLGMLGEKEAVHQQIKILTMQAVFFQSYHELRLVAVFDEAYEKAFAWMRWLPHMRIPSMNVLGMVYSERTRELVLGGMAQILKERAEGRREFRRLPHYLFLIDEPSWIMDHGIMEYLCMDGRELGFSIIYTSYIRANLPEYIGTVLIADSFGEGTLLLEAREYVNQKIRLYSANEIDFEWLARDLSVLKHERGITGFIPQKVSFFELYGIHHPKELGLRRRWRKHQSHKSLAVPLGMRSAGDILYLDLHEKAHGPHGIVAGTTGSGKSELLQSYILSLAVNFHPHEVGFLLIDYKGGGMANLFRELVHHLGTITNLDGAGSMRALISVKAELSRRQRIFRSFQVNHINGYMRLFREGKVSEPIPHLFIISDEFAELKKEQPDFMKELVSAARIGRSLGVHLILATQKPAGVVDEQIVSNSRFKLCLKVQSENDSKEILGTGDAAGLTLPGRAYLKVGNNENYELFQSALSGEAYREEGEKDRKGYDGVYVVNELGQGELPDQDLSGNIGEYRVCKTQLEAVIGMIREEFAKEEAKEVKKPWLPPLGRMLVSPYTQKHTKEKEGMSVRIGIIDLPEQQAQKELAHDFEKEGNLLYVASAGFGKTVFLTTVLTSLAISCDVDALHFYILDYGNHGCLPMKELPHTAEYISFADEERYRKFKKLMTEELAERKKLFAKYGVPSMEAYQELSGKPLKFLLVAVDQFDVVKEAGIEEEDFFTKLTRDGAGLGVYTVITANRINAIRHATLINFKKKIAGYVFDENEVFLTVGRSVVKQTAVKGRVLISGEPVHEAQIYTMAPCEDKAAYSKALKIIIQEIRKNAHGKEAPHIPVLPQEFFSTMLKEYADNAGGYLVGLDVEEVTVRGFPASAGMFVIVGNTGTGKTNILQVLADQAVFHGRTYIFDGRGMELYRYRQAPNVLYAEGKKEIDCFVTEVSEELKDRRRLVKKKLVECSGLSPKKLAEELPFCTILIDDLEDFTELFGTDIDRVSNLVREGAFLGITCIITVHAAKQRGMSSMDRLVRQASNGLVLSSQGVVPIFPVPSMREHPKPGEGLMFKNGIYWRVRLPRYVEGSRFGE